MLCVLVEGKLGLRWADLVVGFEEELCDYCEIVQLGFRMHGQRRNGCVEILLYLHLGMCAGEEVEDISLHRQLFGEQEGIQRFGYICISGFSFEVQTYRGCN
ncbi:hypothetical protein SUGI_0239680 [Cryptomeria japonica]|nr:hypothetical protein SUGI_0239680 [Cryptomeria japonica]